MVDDNVLAGYLKTGLRVEYAMFDYYNELLPLIEDGDAKKTIAFIRLQELDHITDCSRVMAALLKPMTGMRSGEIIGKEAEEFDELLLPLPKGAKVKERLTRAFELEQSYERIYGKIFEHVSPAFYNDLTALVRESRDHAWMLKGLLESL